MGRTESIGSLKKISFYIAIMGGFTLLIFFVLDKGIILEQGRNIVSVPSTGNEWAQFLDSLTHNFKHPLAILLVQVATIILVARFFGYIFKKIGQPTYFVFY